MIIDIHSHIKRNLENPQIAERELLADMKKNHIDIRVVSALNGKSISEQNNYIVDLVSRHYESLIGCAVINPKEYDCLLEAARVLEFPEIKMLEFNSVEHGYYPDTCEHIEEILEMAEGKGMAVKVFTGIGARSMPQQWVEYVRKHPQINFIFLHMGCFDYGYGCVDLALEYDNIYLETSNQYEVQILKKAFQKVPKEKLLFGSSYSERLTKCSVDVFDMFQLEQETLECIYYKNSQKLLFDYTASERNN